MSAHVSYILTTKDRPEQAMKFLKNLELLKRESDEVIVVDGTTDEMPYAHEIFSEIADRIITRRDTSIGHGLNRGIMAATRPYIKLLMDDDWFVPEATHYVFDLMDEMDIQAVQAGGKRWLSEGHPEDAPKYDSIVETVNWGSKPSDVCSYGSTGVGQFFSREAFALGGIIDPRFLIWDMEIMARMIDCGVNVKYCRVYAYEHPLTPESTLRNPSMHERHYREIVAMYKRYGADWEILESRPYKHMTVEEANYNGAFA